MPRARCSATASSPTICASCCATPRSSTRSGVAASAPAPIEREVTGLGTNNGAYRVRVAALGPDHAAGGSGVRLLVTFVDITQARLTERMRVDFIANASHELRTPVTTLLGFIETLQGPAAEDEPARHRFLEIMHREAARMSRLIDDLLSLSRIELDKHVRPQTALDVAPLIADVGRTLAMRLDADQRRLAIRVADGLPAVVADRDQVLQVLHNLVSNALKYGRSGTAITVDADRVEIAGVPMVRVTVGDRGDGIAPRASAAADRALLPHRYQPVAVDGRHRARPRHRQAHHRAPPRRLRDRLGSW